MKATLYHTEVRVYYHVGRSPEKNYLSKPRTVLSSPHTPSTHLASYRAGPHIEVKIYVYVKRSPRKSDRSKP